MSSADLHAWRPAPSCGRGTTEHVKLRLLREITRLVRENHLKKQTASKWGWPRRVLVWATEAVPPSLLNAVFFAPRTGNTPPWHIGTRRKSSMRLLENTFRHLSGIGVTKERQLWDRGILTWNDWEEERAEQLSLFPETGLPPLYAELQEGRAALERGDTEFFAKRLPRAEHYRIALSFPEDVAFLDIETTGLSRYYDQVTLIGVSKGSQFLCHVMGDNIAPMQEVLRSARCIVTFNGMIFDLPFLQMHYPELELPKAHVDLRFFCRRVGLNGGQKAIERELGLLREDSIQDTGGPQAALLWYDYRAGDIDALRHLITYNHADVEGMKRLLDEGIARLLTKDTAYFDGRRRVRFAESPSKLHFATKKPQGRERQRSGGIDGGVRIEPYNGSPYPLVAYQDLVFKSRFESPRIVGIDLTGSEKRPTGFCFLEGNRASTKVLSADTDIIEETLACQPDVISIDSPLSLPKGRTRTTDDDPGRKEFGIMRQCERTLKRRGVNVYPCLIPSMQRLTERGMTLAQQFREQGVPVIESYPGAAQDIMGIPRKRASLDHLTRGLADFGIEGAFRGVRISHDELDAITSAVVGLFFLDGHFEPLGNDDEEYLIIPDLHADPERGRGRLVVGISGEIASGKTTAGEKLEKLGFSYGRYSQVLESELHALGQPVNRNTLQAFGKKAHYDLGQRELGKRLVRRLSGENRIVIDGLRWPEDHAFLAETFGPSFFHIHITCTRQIRKRRYVAMGNPLGDFDAANTHDVEAKVGLLNDLADMKLGNDGVLMEFLNQVEKAILGVTQAGGTP